MRIGNIEIKGQVFSTNVRNYEWSIPNYLSWIRLGAWLFCAEIVSDKAILQKNEQTLQMIKLNKLEHPISMQIFGTDMETFVAAAKYVDQHSDCYVK